MPLAEKAYDIAWTVNDHGEQIQYVTPQHTEVERSGIGDSGELAAKRNLIAGVAAKRRPDSI
jgi:hypothetical protein